MFNNHKKIVLTLIMSWFFSAFSSALFANDSKTVACNNTEIIQKPIKFDKKRIELTQKYRFEHYGIKSKSIEIHPRMIVLHWTCIDDLQRTYKVFYPSMLSNRPDISKESNLNVSAHFLVDRDGKIYQLMPTNWMARHVIGLYSRKTDFQGCCPII